MKKAEMHELIYLFSQKINAISLMKMHKLKKMYLHDCLFIAPSIPPYFSLPSAATLW